TGKVVQAFQNWHSCRSRQLRRLPRTALSCLAERSKNGGCQDSARCAPTRAAREVGIGSRQMKLTFWGAAGEVTGSLHQLDVDGKRYLLDCGLAQGRRKEADRKNRHLPVEAGSVAAVLLSHAHIDHSGNLPTLVKNGFSGPIYTTPATVDLCGAMLADSAFLQQKDAEFVNRRAEYRKKLGRDDKPVVALYGPEDAERTFPLFRATPLGCVKQVAEGLTYRTFDA